MFIIELKEISKNLFKITENRNIGAISEEEQAVLGSKTVFVAGCGGLGCYCADMLSRLGVGHLVLCDCDEFEPSNINRQLYCNVKTMGKNKAVVASQQINQQRLSKVITYPTPITKLNAYDIIQNCDLVIDCLDNIPTRFILQKACEKRGIPMVTGGVSHWHGQVSVIFPGDNTMDKIFGESTTEQHPPVLGFVASTIASCEVAEAAKTLLGEPTLRNKLLIIDLKFFSAKILSLD